MTDKTTFVSFLLDETGSMQSIKDDTVGGFNSYLEALKKERADIVFSLVSFNSNHTKRRYVAEPVADVAPLTEDDYVPEAMTPLIDAAVKLIKATDEAVEKRGDDPNVVIVMQTDGRENVSVQYDNKDLAALIKEKTAAGWEFTFLGAGVDAFDAASQAGVAIRAERVMSYGRRSSREMFDVLAMSHSRYAAEGDAEDLDFTPEQRARVGDVHTHKHLDDAEEKPKSKGRVRRTKKRSSTADDYGLS